MVIKEVSAAVSGAAVDLAVLASSEPMETEPAVVAKLANLRYKSDDTPGIGRLRAGRGFRYIDPRGDRVTDAGHLERIKMLAIPPAWTNVWISVHADGHIQATGRDTRGRKQYIYHPEWRRLRDETKYHRLRQFGALLPTIRAKVDHDMSNAHQPRERVIATIIYLLDQTAIRIGNQQYARQNESFGLTTLRTEHA